ncbi:MAG: glucose-6-phosphate isomerase [Candidatus Omnitrophota bacterium]
MKLDIKNLNNFIDKRELQLMIPELEQAHNMLVDKNGLGSEFLGWLNLPSLWDEKELKKIQDVAADLREISDFIIVIGIGGSYLGARSAIEFLDGVDGVDSSCVLFAGNNMDSAYLSALLRKVMYKNVSVNVISKSGTTTEPAIAFRVIKEFMNKKYEPSELKKRIVCTTTKGKGALYAMAKKEGYRMFYIPEDVGGRFSVLTPVGLLPMACAGIDIKSVIKGAKDIEKNCKSIDLDKNLAYKYALLRNLLYRNGKRIEILSSFHYCFGFILEWWKQLFAESEGKEGKGLFTASAAFSTDLHSIGQLIQEGERNLIETFLEIKRSGVKITIPKEEGDLDQLNYLAGEKLDYVNRMAYKGTAFAHTEGLVPNMTITIDERSSFCLGQLFYFFERACGLSGYLLRINPFNQPGVEAYKKKMFELLGK